MLLFSLLLYCIVVFFTIIRNVATNRMSLDLIYVFTN